MLYIDFRSGLPIYTQIVNQVQAQVASGNLQPGETLTIVFHGRAVLSGDYTGTIMVCINSDFNCKTNIVRTIIR